MDRKDFVFLGCVVTVFIAVATLLMLATYFFQQKECMAHWKESGIESQFGLYSGCMIQIDSKWIPEKAYLKFSEEKSQ